MSEKNESKEEVKELPDASVSEQSDMTANEQLVEILNRTVPVDGQAKAERQRAEQESEFRLHPDKVAVYEVSMSAIDKIDGTNGWYDVQTGSDESRRLGLSDRVEMTKENLVISDRFLVVMNRLPVEEWHCEYAIVSKKEWEESRAESVGAMLGENEQFGDIMMRRGME